jgi:hypothetical protein
MANIVLCDLGGELDTVSVSYVAIPKRFFNESRLCDGVLLSIHLTRPFRII